MRTGMMALAVGLLAAVFMPALPPVWLLLLLPVAVAAEKKSSPAIVGSIEIELGDAVRVRVDAAVDEAALGRVLRALGR